MPKSWAFTVSAIVSLRLRLCFRVIYCGNIDDLVKFWPS